MKCRVQIKVADVRINMKREGATSMDCLIEALRETGPIHENIRLRAGARIDIRVSPIAEVIMVDVLRAEPPTGRVEA